jgi:hypothetical protein
MFPPFQSVPSKGGPVLPVEKVVTQLFRLSTTAVPPCATTPMRPVARPGIRLSEKVSGFVRFVSSADGADMLPAYAHGRRKVNHCDAARLVATMRYSGIASMPWKADAAGM